MGSERQQCHFGAQSGSPHFCLTWLWCDAIRGLTVRLWGWTVVPWNGSLHPHVTHAAETAAGTPAPVGVPQEKQGLGVLELARTSIVRAFASQWLSPRELELAVGVAIPWKSTNTAKQGFCFLETRFSIQHRASEDTQELGNSKRFEEALTKVWMGEGGTGNSVP